MAHDFNRFPELNNSQMALYYFESPHKQITESFHAMVVDVHDGDTLRLRWSMRDFDFPVRFTNIAAPEISEEGGLESRDWLQSFVLGSDVDIIIDPNNRVEKWGRLLGRVVVHGVDVGEESIRAGHSVPYPPSSSGKIPTIEEVL